VRIKLLGEELIAFRDTHGKVGVMDHRCPHRCASLFFGRNEEGGLRCVYHGWKFDADGNCLDMANVPPHQDFKHKVHAKAYRTAERNGLVWCFMGDAKTLPALPELEPALLPEDQVMILFVQRECNYLQALEGDIDTSHFSFLHAGGAKADELDPQEMARYNIVHRQPEYKVDETEWGTMYGAFRPGDPGQTYWRVAHFLFPFWTFPPDGAFEDHVIARAWVPMDDTHTMFVHISWRGNKSGLRTDKFGKTLPGMTMGTELLPNSTEWLGRFRTAQNRSNDFKIDRAAQRSGGLYTGVVGIHMQDQMITESMGGITDHAWEHLAPSDHMITTTRKRLYLAARAFAETGETPETATDSSSFLKARAGDFQAPSKLSLREAYDLKVKASSNPTGRLVAAE
jgi:phthalate 4,5-dioxygenase oxygenase subunit